MTPRPRLTEILSLHFDARAAQARVATYAYLLANVFATIIMMIAILQATQAQAAVLIPQNLTAQDRMAALRILGLGTSAKILSNPYPLGGYKGVEAGLSVENVPTDDLARLGGKLTSPQPDVSYPKLTLGKGVYNNLDVFIQFTPYNRSDEISQFGGIVRWGFYQAQFLPLSASLLVHMNNGNVSNVITTHTYGADFIGGMNVNTVALYAGVGYAESSGTFAGGGNGVTVSGAFEEEHVSGGHVVVGTNIRIFDNGFLGIQIDRYTVAVFSGKIGVRF